MICGVHNMSAVENGRTNGGILVAALHSSSEFRADLESAALPGDRRRGAQGRPGAGPGGLRQGSGALEVAVLERCFP